MEEVDTKKALAFIKEKAEDKPKSTRTGVEFTIPVEIVNEIKAQIKEHKGSFVIPAKAFNALFGWSDKYNKSYYLKNRLNSQYPLGNNKEWKVGCLEKGTLYCFQTKEATKIEETKE